MGTPVQVVRSACDRCHQKKIRCIVAEQSTKCNRCIEQSMECIFSVAGRNGRPPRSDSNATARSQAISPPVSDARPAVPISPSTFSRASSLSSSSSVIAVVTQNDGQAAPSEHHLTAHALAKTPEPTIPASLTSIPDFLEAGLNFFTDGDLAHASTDFHTVLDNFDHQHFLDPALLATPISDHNPRHALADDGATRADAEPVDERQAYLSSCLQQMQAVQSRLHAHESWSHISAPSQAPQHPPRLPNPGSLCTLIDEINTVVKQCLDAHPDQESYFDFNSFMSFVTLFGNAVMIYNALVRSLFSKNVDQQQQHQQSQPIDITYPTMQSSAPSLARHASFPGYLDHNRNATGYQFPPSSVHTTTKPAEPCHYSLTPQVRIGDFVTSQSFSQRIIANMILVQMAITRQLMEHIRQHILQPDGNRSGAVGAHHMFRTSPFETPDGSSRHSRTSSAGGHALAELQIPIVQLLDRLQMRMRSIEFTAMEICGGM